MSREQFTVSLPRVGSNPLSRGEMAEDQPQIQTQIIKESLAYRAKYVVAEERLLNIFQVVPHPQNRGGDPIKQKRCKELSAKLVKDGVDPVEANMNGVCGSNGQGFPRCLCQEH